MKVIILLSIVALSLNVHQYFAESNLQCNFCLSLQTENHKEGLRTF